MNSKQNFEILMGYMRDHERPRPSENQATLIRDHSEIYTFFWEGYWCFLEQNVLDNPFIF